MKTATITELKKELLATPPAELVNICMRLAKYKKENKELLHYLLFESMDEDAFILLAKKEMEEEFQSLNKTSIYLAKKTLRKVQRLATKYIRFSGTHKIEMELLIHYCYLFQNAKLPVRRSKVLKNMYQRNIDRIIKVLSMMHEDLQFDYVDEVNTLKEYLMG